MLVALAVTLVAPFVAYAAVRNGALNVAGAIADPTATLRPGSVIPQVRAVMRTARQPQARLPAGALRIARRAAVQLPLSYEPFFIAARAAEQAGRYGRATILMEEARRRRPNSTAVRLALVGYYGLANAYQLAVNEADMAMRVNVLSIDLLLPAFAKLVAADAKARVAIAAVLARRPPWHARFFEAATTADMSLVDARALVADVQRLSPGTTFDAEEGFLMRMLVKGGEYREARALMTAFRPELGGAVVVDGEFTGLAATSPFNWDLRTSDDGTAEMSRGGADRSALEVNYFGDTELRFAQQILAAAPGAYRLSATSSGTSSAADVRLDWTLSCLPSGRVVATLPMQPLTERMTRREVAATIGGSGCEGQVLALVGQPGELSRSLSAEVSEVGLRAVTRSSAR